jgi:hypothetical protein
MTRFPVVTAVANVLAHAPGLVRHGSKPRRDLARDPRAAPALAAGLRPYDAAVDYAPNQVCVGNRDPESLRALPRPWFAAADPDRHATEMHNPEVTEPAGSGDVPAGNYRLIGALGALRGEIAREAKADFIAAHGLLGYAPTQGHIASAVCYLAHALPAMRAGTVKRASSAG